MGFFGSVCCAILPRPATVAAAVAPRPSECRSVRRLTLLPEVMSASFSVIRRSMGQVSCRRAERVTILEGADEKRETDRLAPPCAAPHPLNRGLRLDRNASTPSLNSALPKATACDTASRSKKSSTLAS